MLALIILLALTPVLQGAMYTRQTCTSYQILNPDTLSCVNCPANMRPNPSQKIPTECICNAGYFPTSVNSCQYLGSNSSVTCGNNQYFNVIDDFGNYASASSVNSCVPCDANAYADMYYICDFRNGTGCVPCARNMHFSASENTCVCVNNTLLETQRGCFTASEISATSSINAASSKYYNLLKYLYPSCTYFNDLLSCSQLVNLCTYSMGYGDATAQAECNFFQVLPTYQYYHYLNTNDAANQFYISPGKFVKNQQIKFKILVYLPTGNLVTEKDMKLPDLLRCGMPANNSIAVQLGNNIQTSCSFNFDYLAEQIQTNTYKNYLYEMFVFGQNGAYFPVSVFIGSSTTPVKRFFLQDTVTSSTYVNVLTNFKLSFSLNSTGYLVSPQLKLSYKKLSIQSGKISPTTDKTQTLTYQIKFVYDLATFWAPFFGIFITINVLVLVQALARTYIAYLNKQPVLGFFFYLANFWSLWMFYFLIVVSGYWFLFCKTTQNVYIFIPDSSTDNFYLTFYIIAGIMGVLRIITVIVDKKDKLTYETFVVNQETTSNSWRQIFIVNSLAQFYTHRTISFFWMFLCLLFFLVGLKWENNAAEVAHTDLNSIYYFNPKNRVFLYFMGGSILLIIGIIFKILRRLVVIKWPYPFEDFIDYCNVTNISLFFMKKRTEQAYYIHASMPNRMEVSFKDLNDAIRRGLTNKSKQILNEYNLAGDQKIYLMYVCKDLHQKFHNMIKKTEDEEHEQLIKHTHKQSSKSKKKEMLTPRQDFVRNKLKQHLRIQNPNQDRSLFRRLLGIPQIGLRDESVLRNRNYFIEDKNCDIVSEIFPNGNQFEEIHTIIIIFLMFLLLTNNTCAAVFIAYFLNEYVLDQWVASSCRKNLQKMTRVREGFML